MTSPLVGAAVEYLNLGLSVIALTGKTPNVKVHRQGLHQALSGAPDPDDITGVLTDVFEHPDTTGIAIVIPFPYVVVDIDGPDGAEQWAELVGEEAFLGPTDRWVAKTGRGLHLWYASTQATGSIKLGSKLDLKGQASYVAAPPSQHPDGGTYKWLLPPSAEAPPKEVPETLARRIANHAFESERRVVGSRMRKVVRQPRFAEGDTVFYAQAGYTALIDAVKNAAEGNRNNMLHWAAATMAEEGGIDEDFDELRDVALSIGLEPVEVKRTIRSARHGR